MLQIAGNSSIIIVMILDADLDVTREDFHKHHAHVYIDTLFHFPHRTQTPKQPFSDRRSE